MQFKKQVGEATLNEEGEATHNKEGEATLKLTYGILTNAILETCRGSNS